MPAMRRQYRLSPSIEERNGTFHVRVAATLDATLSGMIAVERRCSSRVAAEAVLGMLIDRIRATLRTIGAAFERGTPDGPLE
jgi:hypothetical protein